MDLTTPSFAVLLFAGAIAGFTIYLGLPFALVSSKKLRTFANAVSVGILLFLLLEIFERILDQVKNHILGGTSHHEPWLNAFFYSAALVLGVCAAYFGLVGFEQRWLGKSSEKPGEPIPLALIIASGIGLHNFSEGLAIGQELAGGAVKFSLVLILGFALHNATEGFGIAAPLCGKKPTYSLLFLLGLIGGGPTVLGSLIGGSFPYPILEVLFLALASGAILYVIGELHHIGRMYGSHQILATGLLFGFFLAFGTDVFLDAVPKSLNFLH